MPVIEAQSAPVTSGVPLSSPSQLQSGQTKNLEASWLRGRCKSYWSITQNENSL